MNEIVYDMHGSEITTAMVDRIARANDLSYADFVKKFEGQWLELNLNLTIRTVPNDR